MATEEEIRSRRTEEELLDGRKGPPYSTINDCVSCHGSGFVGEEGEEVYCNCRIM